MYTDSNREFARLPSLFKMMYGTSYARQMRLITIDGSRIGCVVPRFLEPSIYVNFYSNNASACIPVATFFEDNYATGTPALAFKFAEVSLKPLFFGNLSCEITSSRAPESTVVNTGVVDEAMGVPSTTATVHSSFWIASITIITILLLIAVLVLYRHRQKEQRLALELQRMTDPPKHFPNVANGATWAQLVRDKQAKQATVAAGIYREPLDTEMQGDDMDSLQIDYLQHALHTRLGAGAGASRSHRLHEADLVYADRGDDGVQSGDVSDDTYSVVSRPYNKRAERHSSLPTQVAEAVLGASPEQLDEYEADLLRATNDIDVALSQLGAPHPATGRRSKDRTIVQSGISGSMLDGEEIGTLSDDTENYLSVRGDTADDTLVKTHAQHAVAGRSSASSQSCSLTRLPSEPLYDDASCVAEDACMVNPGSTATPLTYVVDAHESPDGLDCVYPVACGGSSDDLMRSVSKLTQKQSVTYDYAAPTTRPDEATATDAENDVDPPIHLRQFPTASEYDMACNDSDENVDDAGSIGDSADAVPCFESNHTAHSASWPQNVGVDAPETAVCESQHDCRGVTGTVTNETIDRSDPGGVGTEDACTEEGHRTPDTEAEDTFPSPDKATSQRLSHMTLERPRRPSDTVRRPTRISGSWGGQGSAPMHALAETKPQMGDDESASDCGNKKIDSAQELPVDGHSDASGGVGESASPLDGSPRKSTSHTSYPQTLFKPRTASADDEEAGDVGDLAVDDMHDGAGTVSADSEPSVSAPVSPVSPANPVPEKYGASTSPGNIASEANGKDACTFSPDVAGRLHDASNSPGSLESEPHLVDNTSNIVGEYYDVDGEVVDDEEDE